MEFEIIRDKQRILLVGDSGVQEIKELSKKVLSLLGKPVGFLDESTTEGSLQAPVVFSSYNLQSEEKSDPLWFKHHIILLCFEAGSPNLEANNHLLKSLVESTPKGGTIVYNETPGLISLVNNQKDREDVRLFTYEPLGDENSSLTNGATKELLNRIGVQESQFTESLKQI